MRTTRHRIIARNLAAACLARNWSPASILQAMRTVLGATTRKSQKQLASDILEHIDTAYPPSQATLAKIILHAPAFERAASRLLRSDAPLRMVLKSPRFAPALPIATLDVPTLPTPGELAAWLGLPLEQLDWFTDERRQHGRAKAHGPPRLIEAPKPRLKTMQRRILHGILDRVPVHDAAHGFVAGRSCLSGAQLHTGAAALVSLDIADFFLTTSLGRVHALFRSLGYPHAAARMLTRLCSTVTPETVFDRLPKPARHTRAALRAYGAPHLPQGAPTSPVLANLVAWRLDVRLAGLAASFGAGYTRYADDMTFSGDATFAARTGSLIEAVATIVEDEGYRLNDRKTRVMTRARRQQVTGIVVNEHLNISRASYDALKATLTNCCRHGLDAENRDGHADFRAHLEGRVGWVESLNPARGRRLRAILDRID